MQSSQPDVFTLAKCFLRCYLVGAAFNTRGLQNVGLIFALEPGLQRIYRDGKERQEARKRYMKHYNTHLFWTPLLLGIFLSFEDKVARGLLASAVLESIKNTTVYTLSAIGDSVFAGSLLVFWSLTTALLSLTGSVELLVVWMLCWFLALHLFKFATFVMGYREGLSFLLRLKRWNLINWGVRLKYCNAVLLVVLLHLVWPGEGPAYFWGAGVGVLAVFAWLVSRVSFSREVVAVLLLALFTALPALQRLLQELP